MAEIFFVSLCFCVLENSQSDTEGQPNRHVSCLPLACTEYNVPVAARPAAINQIRHLGYDASLMLELLQSKATAITFPPFNVRPFLISLPSMNSPSSDSLPTRDNNYSPTPSTDNSIASTEAPTASLPAAYVSDKADDTSKLRTFLSILRKYVRNLLEMSRNHDSRKAFEHVYRCLPRLVLGFFRELANLDMRIDSSECPTLPPSDFHYRPSCWNRRRILVSKNERGERAISQ